MLIMNANTAFAENTDPEKQEIPISLTEGELSEETIRTPITSVVLSKTAFAYIGKNRIINKYIKVYAGDTVLERNKDYTVQYQNNRNAGKAKVIVTGTGEYSGILEEQFQITPVKLKSITLPYRVTYGTGRSVKPEPIVRATVNKASKTLKAGTDYTVSYKNNAAEGTTTVTVKGKKNFTGTVAKNFKIIRTHITGSGTTRKVTVSPFGKKYKTMKAAVWTKRNGKNDLTWYKMKKNKSRNWTAAIRLVNLKYNGKCNIYFYADGKYYCKIIFTCPRKDWMKAKAEQFQRDFVWGNASSIDYVKAAINIANNDYYGYGHSWFYDKHTLSCAGLVGLCLTYCGYGDFIKDNPVQPDGTEWGYIDLGTYSGYDWVSVMINEAGATWHNGTYGLKAGDVLYYDYGYTNNHTAIYVGNGLAVEAKGPSGYSQYDDGGEISVSSNWKWLPWQGYFRIPVK